MSLSINQSPPPDAGPALRGVVNTTSQTFGGLKSFGIGGIDFADGSGLSISASGHAVLRYNNSTHQLEVSVNAGSFSALGAFSGSVASWQVPYASCANTFSGTNNLTYASNIFQVIGDWNPTAHTSALTSKALGSSSYGASMLLDASPLASGQKFTIASTGAAAGIGAGYFAIYNETAAAYNFVIDSSGNISSGSATGGSMGTAGLPWANGYFTTNTTTTTIATTVKAPASTGLTLNANNTSNSGKLTISDVSGAGPALYFGPVTNNDYIYTSAAGTFQFKPANTNSISINSTGIFPGGDLTYKSGLSSARWTEVWSRRYAGVEQTIAAASSITISTTLGDSVRITLGSTAITSVTGAAGYAGEFLTVQIIQDGTGGRSISGWATGTNGFVFRYPYTPSTAANARDVLTFIWDTVSSSWQEIGRDVAVGSISGAVASGTVPVSTGSYTLGATNATYAAPSGYPQLTISGDATPVSVPVGPFIVKATGANNNGGACLTFDASSVGGGIYDFFSTGSAAGIGAGHFSFLSSLYGGYVFDIDPSGNVTPGNANVNQTLGSSAKPWNALYVTGDTDGSAKGPFYGKSKSGSTIGVSMTLDATSDPSGASYSFISTGSGAGVGGGHFSVFKTGTGYVFDIDPTGTVTPGNSSVSGSLGSTANPWNNLYMYGGTLSNTATGNTLTISSAYNGTAQAGMVFALPNNPATNRLQGSFRWT